MERLKEDRSYWLVFLLNFLPFGFIYGLWFQYDAIKSLNAACGRKEGSDTSRQSVGFIVFLLLNFITSGIYGVYWVWKQGLRMTDAGRAYGVEDEFLDPERKSTNYIIASCVLTILSVVISFSIYGSLLASIASGNTAGLSGSVFLTFLFPVLLLTAQILAVIAYNKFFMDLNTLCRAYNKETAGFFNVGGNVPAIPAGKQPVSNGSAAPKRIQKIPSLPPVNEPFFGAVTMLTGEYAGSKINLRAGETIVIGRDPARCALICKSDKISRVHVSIQYYSGTYMVTDMSTNGTVSSESGRLPKNQSVKQHSGTILKLGQSNETIRLI